MLQGAVAVRREPSWVVDLGCGTGRDAAALAERFPRAAWLGIDCSEGMIRAASRRRRGFASRWKRSPRVLLADFSALPLPDGGIDAIYSNMALHWAQDLDAALGEWRRVLRTDGMLLCSSLGPGSFRGIRAALGDDEAPVDRLPDVRAVGDRLLAAGYSDPVVAAETIHLEYGASRRMLEELVATGGLGLMTSKDDEWVVGHWDERVGEGAGRLECEVIYATAFGPGPGQPRKTPEGDVATFSLDALRGSLPRTRSV